MTDFDWSDRAIKKLTELWALGLSTAEIGRQMGCSKNAVIGKKNRLGLAGRKSPIRRADGMPPAKRHRRGPTLPKLPALEAMADPIIRAERGTDLVATAERLPPVMRPAPPPPAPRVVFKPRKMEACCWPFGDPKSPLFRFCDAMAMEGKPYCQEHYAIAYAPRRERTDAEIAADEARRLAAHSRMAAGGGWKSL